MEPVRFKTELELPEDVPPWRKCAITHAPARVQRIENITVPKGFRLEEVTIVGRTSPEGAVPPGIVVEPGYTLTIRMANESNEPRKARVVIEGTETFR